MRHYYFVIQQGVARVEDLGGMMFSNDREALAFGKQMIRDMMREDAKHAGRIMEITEAKRAVGSLVFEFDRRTKVRAG